MTVGYVVGKALCESEGIVLRVEVGEFRYQCGPMSGFFGESQCIGFFGCSLECETHQRKVVVGYGVEPGIQGVVVNLRTGAQLESAMAGGIDY